MKTLPLFYYPTTVLIVDDDKTLLSALEDIFIGKNKTHSFFSALDCINFLKDYIVPSYHQKLLQSIDNENGILLQNSPVDFDVTSLSSISNNPERHNEVSVILLDYGMPNLNGFEVAKNSKNQQIHKILLTGKALESEAIEGFNNNLIDRFIQKGREDTEEKILQYIDELMLSYFNKLSLPLLSHLETDHSFPQSDEIFINFFLDLCKKRNITEFYLIDKHGSYLCIDKEGKKFFLVIHSDYSIDFWMSLNKDGLSETQNADIQSRKRIPFFGMKQEAWEVEQNKWDKYLHASSCLEGGRETYYWAIIES